MLIYKILILIDDNPQTFYDYNENYNNPLSSYVKLIKYIQLQRFTTIWDENLWSYREITSHLLQFFPQTIIDVNELV